MIRFLALVATLSTAMIANAGNFFPPEYKRFSFKEGDLLVTQRSDGRFAVNKILKVDRFDFRRNDTINIQGRLLTLPEDDHILIVSAAYGESEFDSFEQARAAALVGKWTVKVEHAPNRAPGAAQGQTVVGRAVVHARELWGYRVWRSEFEKGKAGIF